MSSQQTSENKLWIGNLDKRLSEFELLKIIQRYGKVENFEYLFHTVGPNKGEPRTYCFVEFKKREDAERALQKLNGQMVLSQTLRVRWAKEHVKDKEGGSVQIDNKVDQKVTGNMLSRADKIKAIEGKLKMMEHTDEERTRPPLFHGKHRLLVESDQRKELSRKARQKTRRPYSTARNRKRT